MPQTSIFTPDPCERPARPMRRFVPPAPRPTTDILAELAAPRAQTANRTTQPDAPPRRS